MISRRLLACLLLTALALPIAILVLVGTAALLDGMNDSGGALVLRRIAQAGGIVWAIDLILLVVMLGFHAVGGPRTPAERMRDDDPAQGPRE